MVASEGCSSSVSNSTSRPPASARDLVRFTFYSECREKNLAKFNFCWKCGVPPERASPTPRFPQHTPVVDVAKIQERGTHVLEAMAGRP
ncbi:unnamed protein product, partial [Pylaiella littoralis]